MLYEKICQKWCQNFFDAGKFPGLGSKEDLEFNWKVAMGGVGQNVLFVKVGSSLLEGGWWPNTENMYI